MISSGTGASIPLLLPCLFFCFSSLAAPAKKLVASEILAASQPSDWRTPKDEDLLYFDISPRGKIIIELAPDFAPAHVARIKSLARQKYWDDLAIVRVQDNYVVQWADPLAGDAKLKKKIKDRETKLPVELDVALEKSLPFKAMPDADTYAKETGFSNGMPVGRDSKTKKMWLLHCYGAVGVGRDNAPDSGDGTELYAVIGHAPRHLDRNVTVVGRVLQGMEHLSSLPRGHGNLGFYDKDKKEKPLPIRSMRLGSEIPEKERVSLEILRTETPLFDQLVSARRNRAEEWFHFQAGSIDICNFQIPVREKN